MALTLGVVGTAAGLPIIVLLWANLRNRSLGFWPHEDRHGWQSLVFWTGFRVLNVCALALAAVDWQPLPPDSLIRPAAGVLAALGALAYVAACMHLGRSNLYCGRDGLVTHGIYAWSRNPQYALAIPSYAALALACHSLPMAWLGVQLMAVFVLMALNEEPWLADTYGDDYRRYRTIVPRFYNFRRLAATFHQAGGKPTRRA